ncbi:MAG: cellulase family glycosylhydrolase [Clostridiales bacterium]|nr:cellulase family glycosylhydrolase [Clostridiales bacterium]
MKNWTKKCAIRIIAAVIAFAVAAAIYGCAKENDDKGTNDVKEIQLNGLCVPLTGAYGRKLDMNKIFDIIEAMNVKALRNWMHATVLLDDPTTVNEKNAKLQHEWIAELKSRGIEQILGMSHYAFLPNGSSQEDASAVPYPDKTEGSMYMQFLADYETTWYTLASEFPEVDLWEVGNETNHDPFLHPIGYTSRQVKFTQREKAEITADMVYAAAAGVRRANPDAEIIFPGMAPVDGIASMADFLELVYKAIESGNCGNGCTDPDEYFTAVAWHPYMKDDEFTIDKWVDENNQIYDVMVKHGDADKGVYFTEFGFSDGGSSEADAKEGEWFKEMYEAVTTRMDYVTSIYPFRLLEDKGAAKWGGTVEIYYGMFEVSDDKQTLTPKAKARAICEVYGGNCELLDK